MAGTVTVTAKKEPCINTGFLKAGNETRTHDPFITSLKNRFLYLCLFLYKP